MLSVVIPTLNEGKAIGKIVKDIMKLSVDKEVVVVDGLSTDNTIEQARRCGARVVTERRRGKGIAMMTGVRRAKGDVICFMDGDGTYPTRYIPRMLRLLKDCDMVVGSRLMLKRNANDSLDTYLHYKFFPYVFGRIYYSKFKTSEPMTGFRVMRKSTWDKLNIVSMDFMVETEMEVNMAKNGMKVIEIPIPCVKRIGFSKFERELGTMIRMARYASKHEKYLKNLNVVRKVG